MADGDGTLAVTGGAGCCVLERGRCPGADRGEISGQDGAHAQLTRCEAAHRSHGIVREDLDARAARNLHAGAGEQVGEGGKGFRREG